MLVNLIKGKNLGIKDLDKKCVTIHVEVPQVNIYDYVDKALTLTVKHQGMQDQVLDCSVSKDGKPYQFNASLDSFFLKLDVIIPDVLLLGILCSGELNLSFPKDEPKP